MILFKNFYTKKNKKLVDNLNRMNFRTDKIVAILVESNNKVIAEVPVFDLSIDVSKNLWRLKASPSIFENVNITGPFRGAIVNKTLNNIALISTNLQLHHKNLSNIDVAISWNHKGTIYLNEV